MGAGIAVVASYRQRHPVVKRLGVVVAFGHFPYLVTLFAVLALVGSIAVEIDLLCLQDGRRHQCSCQ